MESDKDPFMKTPYTEEWNFGIQQQVGVTAALAADYVGFPRQPAIPQWSTLFFRIYLLAIANASRIAICIESCRQFAAKNLCI